MAMLIERNQGLATIFKRPFADLVFWKLHDFWIIPTGD
jgi:hypothetical protein